MNANRIQLAHDTWQATLSLLPPAIASDLTVPAKDPAEFKKYEDNPEATIRIARLRILPATKEPPRFWNAGWCFYELGIGIYGSASVLGRVAFLQFPNQQSQASNHYAPQVATILKALAQKRPQDFTFSGLSPKGAPMPMLARVYRSSPSLKFFDPQLAAQDLAWLIQASLPRFRGLPG